MFRMFVVDEMVIMEFKSDNKDVIMHRCVFKPVYVFMNVCV